MKKLVSGFTAALLLLALSCANEQKTQEEAQNAVRTELMAVHDEVMPRMGELTMLAGQVKQLLQDSSLNSSTRTEIEVLLSQMETAEDGMMDWMAAYKQPEVLRSSMDHASIMAYLEKEKKTISQVAVQINEGIAKGKQMIANQMNTK